MDRNLEHAPYRDAGLPTDERVGDLLARMTLEEKLVQLGGVQSTSLIEGERVSEAKAAEALRHGAGHLTRIGGGTMGPGGAGRAPPECRVAEAPVRPRSH